MRKKREIDIAAKEWEAHGKSKHAAYLLQGPKLNTAEDYVNNYADKVPLSNLGQEFVQVYQIERARSLQEEEGRRRRELETAQKLVTTNKKLRQLVMALILSLVMAIGVGVFARLQWEMAKQQSEVIKQRSENIKQRSEITTLRYKGVLHERVKQYQLALNYYQQALKIARNINDKRAQINNLSDCGMMYMSLNKPELAVDYFEQSRKIHEQLGDTEGLKFEQNNLISAYSKMGEVKKALDLYQQFTGIKGSGREVGYINHINCLSDAFELYRDTKKLPLDFFTHLYHADQLKVTKENCEISIRFQEGQLILVSMANSPYIVLEKPLSPPSISDMLSKGAEWLKNWFFLPIISDKSEGILSAIK